MVVHKGLLDLFPQDDACVAAGASSAAHQDRNHVLNFCFHHLKRPPPPNTQSLHSQCWRTRPATLSAATTPSSKVACLSLFTLAYRIRHESPGFRAVVNGVVAFLTLALGLDHHLFSGLGSVLLQVRCRAKAFHWHSSCSDCSLIERSRARAQLPHSRTMETEADTVGMDLLAKVANMFLLPPLALMFPYPLELSGVHRPSSHGPRVRNLPAKLQETGVDAGAVRTRAQRPAPRAHPQLPALPSLFDPRVVWCRYLSTHPSHSDRIGHLKDSVQQKQAEMLQRCKMPLQNAKACAR